MNLFEIVRAQAANYPVTVLCKLLGVSKSGYYAYVGRRPSERADNDLRITTAAESFFASLKKECLSRRPFATRTEAYDAVAGYIDGFYNLVRRHSALGYVSPIEHEQHHCSRNYAA